jgi:hypothetical protein
MRGALVQRPSICEHPPKSGARARFYSVVDLVNRLERPVTGGRLLPGTSTGQGLRPAARQPNRELAKPLRKEIARWGDGRSTRYSPVPGPPSTGPPHRRPTKQLRNRVCQPERKSCQPLAQILQMRSSKSACFTGKNGERGGTRALEPMIKRPLSYQQDQSAFRHNPLSIWH